MNRREAAFALVVALAGAASAAPLPPLVDLEGQEIPVPVPLPARVPPPLLERARPDLGPSADRLGKDPAAAKWRSVEAAYGKIAEVREEEARTVEKLKAECAAEPQPTPKAAAACDKRVADARSKARAKAAAIEGALRRDRDAAVDGLIRFVNRNQDDAGRTPDALLLVASMKIDQALETHAAAMDKYHRAKPGKNAAPKPDFTAALRACKNLMNWFPKYDRIDVARYFHGWLLEQVDDQPAAAAAFRELVSHDPSSALAQEVWFRLGRLQAMMVHGSADRELLRSAERSLSSSAAGEEARFVRPALDLLVPTRYRLDMPDAALEAAQRLLRLVPRGLEGEDTAAAERLAGILLADRAVYGFAARLKALQAGENPLLRPAVLSSAAERLRRSGRHAEAAAAALEAVDLAPARLEAPGLLVDAALDLRRAGDADSAEKALDRARAMLAEGSDWAKTNPDRRAADKLAESAKQAAAATVEAVRWDGAAGVRAALALCGMVLRAADPTFDRTQVSVEGPAATPAVYGSVAAPDVAACLAKRMEGAPSAVRLQGTVTLVPADK